MTKRVLILATDGFEQSELTGPRDALNQAGIETTVASPKSGEIKGWQHTDWGDPVAVDLSLDDANVGDFDALVLPGGQMNPDALRMEPKAIDLVRAFAESGKPVAAICHGPQLLIETGMLRGRNMTSFPSIRTDLENAGVHWADVEVVTDRGLTTSRSPKDLEAFNKRLIEEIAQSNFANSPVL